MDEMESLRIEAELDRQKSARGGNRNQSNGNGSGSENRDSGVADVEVCPGTGSYQASSPGGNSGCGGDPHTELKRSALSNSLLDMHEQCKYLAKRSLFD
jgi:IQ motif and SEC7 domain-containing protein